jgi:hypothetical protein
MRYRTWCGLAFGLLLTATSMAACSSDDESAEGSPVGRDDGPNKKPGSAADVNLPTLSRLTVDELQLTVPLIAGMDENAQWIQWLVNKGAGPVDAYSNEGLGKMMGRPDFVAVTNEATAPDTLYVKFARDMAREVCQRIRTADENRSSGFTLWPKAPIDSAASDDEITNNLSRLILRFLGLRLQAGDDLLETYRQVYLTARGSTTDSDAQKNGWQGVCMALFQDPAFYLH